MSGLVALVTGASRGVGAALAAELARRGHVVVAGMRVPRPDPAAGVEAVPLDVTDDRSVAEAVAAALATHGRLDVVVNNAGTAVLGPVEAATPEDLRRQFEVNVLGPQRVARAVLPHLREARRGLLLQVSSSFGRVVLPGRGVYAASKWALEALSETLRYEVASWSVDCVLAELGPVAMSLLPAEGWNTADRDRARAYGELAEIERRDRRARFQQPASPAMDPAVVAVALADLIEQPAPRPARVVIHPAPEALRDYNAHHERLVTAMLTARGYLSPA